MFDALCIKQEFSAKLKSKYSGEAIPLQTWTGLEGFSSLRLSDFITIGT
jgi:hypothetical protein